MLDSVLVAMQRPAQNIDDGEIIKITAKIQTGLKKVI
ncbi:MAG: hypothetical protein ACI85H_001526 [Paracoccaceae bacterium]|jgi:hypothetical protein